MDLKEQTLRLLETKGPSVPAELTSALKSDTMLTGAVLSQLVSEKKVFVTHAKLGGSKLYYTPKHHHNIVRLRSHLNEKDRSLFDILEQQKVIRDDTLTPLQRTNARALKDFAFPIKVSYQGQDLLFWRWFLTTQQEAQQAIKQILGVKPKKPEHSKEIQPSKTESPSIQSTQPTQEENTKEKDVSEQETTPQDKQVENPPEQTGATKPKKPTKQPVKQTSETEEFLKKIYDYCNEKNIDIESTQKIRKTEYNFVVYLPTPVGKATYYMKARDKKSSNEGDVATALLEAQLKHLPLVYLITGKVTKKTKESKQFESVLFVESWE